MLNRFSKFACATVVFLLMADILAPKPAAAQGVEFAVGYSFLRDNEIKDNLPAGIFASLGVGVNSWLSLVGEVASNRKTYDTPGDDITLKVDFYGAGLRFAGHSGKAHPYAQVLVGAARGRISLLGQSESGNDFAWQPGAGVDVDFSRHVGMRFGVNGRFIQGDNATVKETQVVVGLVFSGGR